MTSHSIEGLSDGGLREQYARLIDPEALEKFELYQAHARACIDAGHEETASLWIELSHRTADATFAKADAILALSAAPERVEGGGTDSSSQSQPCAEKGPQPFSHDAPLSGGRGE